MDKIIKERLAKLFIDGIELIEAEEECQNPLCLAKVAIVDSYLHGLARACTELLPSEQVEEIKRNIDNIEFYFDEDGYFMPIANEQQFYTD